MALSDILLNIGEKGFRTEIKGLEKIDYSAPGILAPNHTSLADVAILLKHLPKDKEVYFVANTMIAKRFKVLMKGRKIITVDPLNPYSVRYMVKLVNSGKLLVIFPEGRITRTGGLMKVYPGVGYISMKTGAKIYPITIDGLERSKFSYLRHMNKTVLFPKVRVQIGDPYTINRVEGISMKIQKEKAADTILRMMQRERFNIKQKESVNLFNEVLETASLFGMNTQISEDINGIARYKDLLLKTYVLSNKLEEIIGKDQKVGVLMPNANGHVVVLLSLFRIGKTPAILNYSVGKQSIQDACETASIRTVITSKEFIEKGKLEPLLEGIQEMGVRIVYIDQVKQENKEKKDTRILVEKNRNTTEVSLSVSDMVKGASQFFLRKRSNHTENELILFTSGSESKPKGVVLTHENIFSNIHQAKSTIDLTSQDKFLNALPMFHSFGLTAGTLLPLLIGVPLFLYPSPLHMKVIPELAYDRMATVIFGTSTFLSGYGRNAHPYDFFKLRYVFAGAEKLKPEVRDQWADKFGVRIFEGYGITETAPILSLNTPLAHKKDTVGRFLPGIEYKLELVEGIEKGGKLLVKGPNVMKGYLIHNQGFIPNTDWFDTGDVVEVDEDGYISIKSRVKRFAKIGGEMISLNLVEELAATCFKKEGFASVNIPDIRKGEQIVLFTTEEEIAKEAFRSFLSENGHSPLMLPNQIKFIDKLPLLGSGKTDYVTLKKLAEQ